MNLSVQGPSLNLDTRSAVPAPFSFGAVAMFATKCANEAETATRSRTCHRPSRPYTDGGDFPQDEQEVQSLTPKPDTATGRAARGTNSSGAAGSTASGTSRYEAPGSTAHTNATHSGHEPGAWGFEEAPEPEAATGSTTTASATHRGYEPGARGWEEEPGALPPLSPEERDFFTHEVVSGLAGLGISISTAQYLIDIHLQIHTVTGREDADMNRQAWRAVYGFQLGMTTDRWVCPCGKPFLEPRHWWSHFTHSQKGWWHGLIKENVHQAWMRSKHDDIHPCILAAESASALDRQSALGTYNAAVARRVVGPAPQKRMQNQGPNCCFFTAAAGERGRKLGQYCPWVNATATRQQLSSNRRLEQYCPWVTAAATRRQLSRARRLEQYCPWATAAATRRQLSRVRRLEQYCPWATAAATRRQLSKSRWLEQYCPWATAATTRRQLSKSRWLEQYCPWVTAAATRRQLFSRRQEAAL